MELRLDPFPHDYGAQDGLNSVLGHSSVKHSWRSWNIHVAMHHGSSAAAAKHGHESLMAAWCDKEADRDVTRRDLVFWESLYCLFSSFGTLICFSSVALQGGAEVPTHAEVIFNDNLPIINQWLGNWVQGRKVVRTGQWGDEKRDPIWGGWGIRQEFGMNSFKLEDFLIQDQDLWVFSSSKAHYLSEKPEVMETVLRKCLASSSWNI